MAEITVVEMCLDSSMYSPADENIYFKTQGTVLNEQKKL